MESISKYPVKHIFNFDPNRPWHAGFCQFGFHGRRGAQYLLNYNAHWLGHLTPRDEFLWTAGAIDPQLSSTHISIPIKYPHYITEVPDGSLLLSSNGTNQVYKIWPKQECAELFIDTKAEGLIDIGNVVYDGHGSLWIHEIEGCRVWQFNLAGRMIRVLGDSEPGFQKGCVPFDEVLFNWIYDLRVGSEGEIYVLDSKNFSVRRIDLHDRTVTTVVGTGKPGYTGDGGPAIKATLGSDPEQYFDGPYSLSVDEWGNLFIGDTWNHVVRRVDAYTQRISTIAGNPDATPGARNIPEERDPLKLNFPKICSMDYFGGCLYIPDDNNDLVILDVSVQPE